MIGKTVLAACLAALAALKLMACSGCDDCDEPKISYRYINQSSHDVEIILVDRRTDTLEPTGSIAKQDSVEFVGKEGGFLTPYQFSPYPETKAIIEFASVPRRCLVFAGAISDSTLDLRSPRAYRGNGSPFSYSISDSLFEKAKDCP